MPGASIEDSAILMVGGTARWIICDHTSRNEIVFRNRGAYSHYLQVKVLFVSIILSINEIIDEWNKYNMSSFFSQSITRLQVYNLKKRRLNHTYYNIIKFRIEI